MSDSIDHGRFDMNVGDRQPGLQSSLGHLALAASISIFLLIVLGGIVRVTGSGGACPDWPTCFGVWTPPLGESATIDYLHRAATILVAPLVLGLAVLASIATSVTTDASGPPPHALTEAFQAAFLGGAGFHEGHAHPFYYLLLALMAGFLPLTLAAPAVAPPPLRPPAATTCATPWLRPPPRLRSAGP